jgi:RHS repeat-associated protein
VWYDLLSDGLSSTTVVVTSTGVVAAQLFAPYGQGRWAGGTMPTSYAFTGQRADSTTGLDYYGARYYDPAAGTFISADTVLGKGAGLNRYGYVAGNPETLTDPTGHLFNKPCLDGEWCGGSPGGPGGTVGGGQCPDRQSECSSGGSGSGGGKNPDASNTGGTSPTPPTNPCGVQDLCDTGGFSDYGNLFNQVGHNTSELTAIGYWGLLTLIQLLDTLLGKIDLQLQQKIDQNSHGPTPTGVVLGVLIGGAVGGAVGGLLGFFFGAAIGSVPGAVVGAGIGVGVGATLGGFFGGAISSGNPSNYIEAKTFVDGQFKTVLDYLQGLEPVIGPNNTTAIITVDEGQYNSTYGYSALEANLVSLTSVSQPGLPPTPTASEPTSSSEAF